MTSASPCLQKFNNLACSPSILHHGKDQPTRNHSVHGRVSNVHGSHKSFLIVRIIHALMLAVGNVSSASFALKTLSCSYVNQKAPVVRKGGDLTKKATRLGLQKPPSNLLSEAVSFSYTVSLFWEWLKTTVYLNSQPSISGGLV